MVQLEEHETLSSHRTMTPATPPKPRIWDDENAFDAFQVEDSKRNIDFVITTCPRAHQVHDYQPSRNRGSNHAKQVKDSRKSKVSMGHVEILMSELDNSNLMVAPEGWNRFQVRCSTDDLSNLTIEEIEETHFAPPLSSSKRVSNQMKSPKQDITLNRTRAHPSNRIRENSSSHDSDQKPDINMSNLEGQSTSYSVNNIRGNRRASNSPFNGSTSSIRQASDRGMASEPISEDIKYAVPVDLDMKNSSESGSPPRAGSAGHDGDDNQNREEARFENQSHIHHSARFTPSLISSTHSHSLTPTRSSNPSSRLTLAPNSHHAVSSSSSSSSSANHPEPVGPGGFITESEECQSEAQLENLPWHHAHAPSDDDRNGSISKASPSSSSDQHPQQVKFNQSRSSESFGSQPSPSLQNPQQEKFNQSRSPESFRSQPSPSLASEPQGLDLNCSLDHDVAPRTIKPGGSKKHFTSTPRGHIQHPSPFPRTIPAKLVPSTSGDQNQLLSNCPIIEIASEDPKVAARAAAILKVHHGFVPRGCKVENSNSISGDQLEREMESSVRKEEADLSLRLLNNSSAQPSMFLRTLQTKKIFQQNFNEHRDDNDQDFPSPRFSFSYNDDLDNNDLSNNCENSGHIQKSLSHQNNLHSEISPSSSINTIHQQSSRKTPQINSSSKMVQQHNVNVSNSKKDDQNRHSHRKKSLKEELKQTNYCVKFDSWTQSDWKILEYCLKKIEREELESMRSRSENSSVFIHIKPEDVVLKLLDALELDRDNCKLEWEWTKMIHRVIALQKRKSIKGENSSRRSRAGSSSTMSSHRGFNESNPHTIRRPHNHETNPSSSSSSQLKMMTSEPVTNSQTNLVAASDSQVSDSRSSKVYPSLDHIRRLFTGSRLNKPTLIEENQKRQTRNIEITDKHNKPIDPNQPIHETLTKTTPSGVRRVPKPPPISKLFLEQSMKRIQSYWSLKFTSRRKVGHGKIWKIIEVFEDQIERNSAQLEPPSQYNCSLHRELSQRKRALDHPSSDFIQDDHDHMSDLLFESSDSLYHPSFVHDSYSEKHSLHLPKFKKFKK